MSSFVNKMMSFIGLDGNDFNEDYYADDALQENGYDEYDDEPVIDRLNARRSSRVVKLHDNAAAPQMKVVVIQPESFEEARTITDHLKGRKPIVVNLESVEKNVARRIVDFLSGSVYALDGEIQKISNGIFLLVPSNVSIMGEEMQAAKGSFPWNN